MSYITQLSHNHILWVAIFSWFIAQTLKIITVLLNEHRLDLTQFFAAGGMPSSHSSFVTALAVSIGQVHGYDSSLFAIAAVFSCIVMYDAAHVRLQAGKQAVIINQMIEILGNPDLKPEERLKEILGHTPIQVLVGGVLGVIIGLLFFGS